MNYFEFDSHCFNISCSEQGIILIVSAKCEHKSFQKFINCAVENYYDKNYIYEGSYAWITLPELKAQIINIPASEADKKNFFQLIEGMNKRIYIELEEIENIVTVFEKEWNDCTYAFETKNCRYYFNWITTA